MTRKQQIGIIVLFLSILFAIPVIQGILEIRAGEKPYLVNLFIHRPTEKNLRKFERELEDRSFIENALRPPMQYLQYLIGRDAGNKAIPGLNGWLFYRPGMDFLTCPYYNDPRIIMPAAGAPKQDWDVVAAITDFRDQLKKRGIDLLVVPVPGKASIYPEMLTRRKIDNIEKIPAHTKKLINELRGRNVQVIDLFELFLEEKGKNDTAAKEKMYLPRDTHWTARALRLAAKAIADRVREKEWYRERELVTEYELRDTTVSRYGDIGEMTQIPHNRKLFKIQTTCAYRVFEKKSGKPYRNNKKSPILYLGDSFSRIYQTDTPKSAGIIAHIAYELSMPLKAIVNNGGASTLVRRQLVRKKRYLQNTRLVIWEFVERDIRFGMEGWQLIDLPE